MKQILLLIISLVFTTLYSQKTDTGIEVEYQLFIDGDLPIKYPAILYINDSVTIYQTQHRLKEEWSGGKLKLDGESFFSTAKTVEDGYMKINHYNQEILFFDLLPTVGVFVTDNYPQFDWKISDEAKTVAGYSCVKATATYRGRDWIAWFTPDIAVPYGPWKLHGLPGLILEAYDITEIFTMRATIVEHVKSVLFDQDFKKLRTTVNQKPISYKQFLAERTEAFDNMIKQMNSNGGNMTFEEAPRSGYELKYEWEK